MKPRPWCYDSLLDGVRVEWEAHDESCESLPWFWLGRHGGVSCPSDLWSCDDCGVCWLFEGVAVLDDDAEDDEIYLCACCARKRGHAIGKNSLGVYIEGRG